MSSLFQKIEIYNKLFQYCVVHNQKEAECIIATHSYWSYVYATRVIKQRFEYGEGSIRSNAYWRDVYRRVMR